MGQTDLQRGRPPLTAIVRASMSDPIAHLAQDSHWICHCHRRIKDASDPAHSRSVRRAMLFTAWLPSQLPSREEWRLESMRPCARRTIEISLPHLAPCAYRSIIGHGGQSLQEQPLGAASCDHRCIFSTRCKHLERSAYQRRFDCGGVANAWRYGGGKGFGGRHTDGSSIHRRIGKTCVDSWGPPHQRRSTPFIRTCNENVEASEMRRHHCCQ